MAINEDRFLQQRSALPLLPARPMTIEKQPHEERSKGKKTRQSVENVVDMMLASKLLAENVLFETVLHHPKVVWIQDETERSGYVFARESDAVALQTKKNGFTMYMPTNPIVYLVNGEPYHLLTRIDSTRSKPNITRLEREPSPILSAARVNDCLTAMVICFYEAYITELEQAMTRKTADFYSQFYMKQYAENELATFKTKISELNDNHMNWHPRGNGHEQLVDYIMALPLLTSQIGDELRCDSHPQGLVTVIASY